MKSKGILVGAICTIAFGYAVSSYGSGIVTPEVVDASSVEEKRDEVRKRTKRILTKLFDSHPRAKRDVEGAAGYGAFSNVGFKLFVAGTGKGKGMIVDNATGKETFMRMVELQAGLGFGIEKLRLVFVFETPSVMEKFIDRGWELGGAASIAAKTANHGKAFNGALSVSPGVWVYQMTHAGIAVELAGKGSRYYRDKKLN